MIVTTVGHLPIGYFLVCVVVRDFGRIDVIYFGEIDMTGIIILLFSISVFSYMIHDSLFVWLNASAYWFLP